MDLFKSLSRPFVSHVQEETFDLSYMDENGAIIHIKGGYQHAETPDRGCVVDNIDFRIEPEGIDWHPDDVFPMIRAEIQDVCGSKCHIEDKFIAGIESI